MSFSVSVSQVLSDKGSDAVWKVAVVDLFGLVVKLVAISVNSIISKQTKSEADLTHRCSALE